MKFLRILYLYVLGSHWSFNGKDIIISILFEFSQRAVTLFHLLTDYSFVKELVN